MCASFLAPLSSTHDVRLFEIFMAYDALRLRNVIQLVGILRASPSYPVFAWLLTRMWSISVFHAALLVMAALQVHETRTAIVTSPGKNWTQDYLVCYLRSLVCPADVHVLDSMAMAQGLYGQECSLS